MLDFYQLDNMILGSYLVDVFVTSECIHLYILCILPRCLFQEVSVTYWSHVIPQCAYREIQ